MSTIYIECAELEYIKYFDNKALCKAVHMKTKCGNELDKVAKKSIYCGHNLYVYYTYRLR
jgi:hypothetical protein